MRNRRKEDFVVGVSVVALSVAALWHTLQMPTLAPRWLVSPASVPAVLWSVLLLLGLILSVVSLRQGQLSNGSQAREQRGQPDQDAGAVSEERTAVRRLWLAAGSVALLIFVLIPLLGFYPSFFLFVLFGSFVFGERVRLSSALLASCVVVGSLYGALTVLLKLPLR